MSERGSKMSRCQSSEQYLEIIGRDPNEFLSWMVAMDKTCSYRYDPQAKQQTMYWRHRGLPSPKKIPSVQSAENSSPGFFGNKTASSSLIIFQSARIATRCITHPCWCNWGTFWRENPLGFSPMWFCSCTTMHRFTGHLQPRKTSLPEHPISWPPTIFSGSGPVGLPPPTWSE